MALIKKQSEVVPKASRQHVLLVDDDEPVRGVLDRLLVRAGYLVSPFADAETAISVLPFVSFDIVVTDVQMPGQDGFSVLRAVQEICPHVPVVFVSGAATTSIVQRALEAGVHAFLAKPIDVARLLEVLDELSRGEKPDEDTQNEVR